MRCTLFRITEQNVFYDLLLLAKLVVINFPRIPLFLQLSSNDFDLHLYCIVYFKMLCKGVNLKWFVALSMRILLKYFP